MASSRINGGKPQKYIIAGPGWSGALPQGSTQVKSPTGMVWILGRIYCAGTPEDYQTVTAAPSVTAIRLRFNSDEL